MDIFFVLGLGMGVKGVALGTLLSEYGAAGIGVFTVFTIQKRLPGSWNMKRIVAKEKVLKSLSVNGDILIRSLALIVVFTWFTASSAALGDVTLAANAVLLHFLTVSAYFLDGIALAAEKFIGESVGQRSKRNFIDAAKLTTIWAAGIAALISFCLLICGPAIINFMTVDPDVRALAKDFVIFAALAPFIGVWCFQLDGIFIGATATSFMRNSMLFSTLLFFVTWKGLEDFGNLGLWLSLLSHFIYRTITLYLKLPKVIKAVGHNPSN